MHVLYNLQVKRYFKFQGEKSENSKSYPRNSQTLTLLTGILS
jgi:hypothetical protein